MGYSLAKFQKGLLLLAILFSAFTVSAQRVITGTVTDAENGDPLIGASILIVGTSSGTVTDIDGTYSLEVPASATQLIFSYTGYNAQTITIGASNVMDVALAPGQVLDEIVVIGYGTVKKEDATGSIQTVGTERFNKGAITSPQELLAGKIAGVAVTTSSEPGGGATIRIRGGSSLSATNDPLIVIDGVPVDNGGIAGSRNALNVVNPNDIETFTVLKDASATAIYGSRASNGVILITTKKGALGKKIGVNYSGSVAFSNRANEVDVLSPDAFRDLITTRFAEGHPARALLGNANTDWQSEIFQTGVTNDHNLSLSGGIGILPYRISLGYTDRSGILKTDEFNRTTASLNLSPGFFDNRLQFNINLKTMFSKDHFANQGAIGSAAAFDPTQPVFGGENPYGGYFTWLSSDGTPNRLASANPLALLEQTNNNSNVRRYIANAQVDYRFAFLPELRANLNVGYDYSHGEGTAITDPNAAFDFTNGGRKGEYEQDKKNTLLEYYMDYTKQFGSSNLSVMGGYSWQRFFRDDYNFATNFAGNLILAPANFNPAEYYLVSLFGRVNYSLNDRYLLTLTLRRDGTSRFSEDNRWGLFPAAAFAWKIYDGNGSGTLSNLKLRLGYGVTGQQDIGGDYYPYLARYISSQSTANYQFGNGFVTTLRPNGYDANIKWEETATYNVGFDYGFLNDRLYGSIDYYYRKTTDLINFIPVPAGTNLTNFINTNVGDLQNTGVEFAINAVAVKTKDVTWDLGFNVALNKNEITRLTATDDPNYLGVFTGGISGGVGNTIQIHSVGYPASSFFVFEQVYDANGTPIEGLYVDRNGDGQITPDDRYHLEQPAADANIGFTSTLNYKNLDFSFAGRAAVGNYIYNNILSDQAFYNRLYNSTGYLLNANPATAAIDFTVPQYFSDHFVQNGSFLRLDHITLGYNFSNLLNKGIRARLFATVQNPILITDYTGLDPEVFNGIDGNIYPRSRTFLFGLNANF
ncbi:MAG: TonB-dependent receptor [Lewinellaceae bacterium]|nr:TonB-dependent receptor [Lewinellaceae bacterium]